MKKNKMLRIASVMLVLALITTCVISGTFAKYVTSKTGGSDSARVAKWGIGITIDGGSVFENSYNEGLVVGTDSALVVAPDTENEVANVVTITGTPEVAYTLKFEFTGITDIKVAKDLVMDPDPTGESDTYTVPEDYYPVTFTLSGKIGGVEISKSGPISDFATAYSVDIPANADRSGDTDITLTWSWSGETGHDAEDTYLGNNGERNTIAYTLKVTATQKLSA